MPTARKVTSAASRVVLVFGDPRNGKSYLASALHKQYGYVVVSLDDVYVQFVQEQFPSLYLPALGQVIAQHFQTMLSVFNGGAAARAWASHLAALVTARSKEHRLLVVEGFLLPPALAQIRQRLPATTAVTVVEARQRQYFVAQSVGNIHKRKGIE